MADAVLVEQRDRILIVRINRPAARNAIDAAVTAGIATAMDELDGRRDLSIGILTGEGGADPAGLRVGRRPGRRLGLRRETAAGMARW
jgi:enoyl-CoA hydratase